MNNTLPLTTRLRRGLQRVSTALMRGALGLMALMLTLGMLALGLLMGTVLVVWALLRGRRPILSRRGGAMGGFRAARPQRDVIDIEAKEVSG